MSFQTHSVRAASERRRGALIVAVCVLILGAWFVFPKPFLYLGAQLTRPLTMIISWYTHSTGAIPTYFRTIDELRAERDALREEVASYATLRDERAYVEASNRALIALGGTQASSTDILAGVISAPPAVPYDIVLVDRGAVHGVEEGAAVYRDTLYAIGFVHTVFAEQSLIQLFSSPRAETVVYVPEGGIFAKAEGVGNGVVRVRVPQDVAVSIGSAVLLPGVDGSLLGFVRTIEAEQTSPEKYAFVSTGVPLAYHRVRIGAHARSTITFDEAERIVRERVRDMRLVEIPAVYMYESTATTSTESGEMEE